MDSTKQMGGSSSSFKDLFGPKDSSSSSPPSSNELFRSVFGPSSTGLGKDSSHSVFTGSARKQDLGSQYGSGKHGNSENINHRGKGDSYGHNSRDERYHQSETTEPCYFSSSIYYGGQEVYSPTSQPTVSQHIFKKDGGDDDPDGSNMNSASRGNWWQGSLYY